jgi:hypothetical protein
VVGVFDYDTWTGYLYINGDLKATKTGPAAEIRTANLPTYIGGIPGHHHYDFDGTIDEVTIYNRELTSEEVMADYQQFPISRWQFENDLLDSVGTNHGTGHNGVTFTEGIVGQAASLDGYSFVSIADDESLDLTEAMTLELWVKPTAYPPQTYHNIISKGDPHMHGYQAPWQIAVHANAGLGVYRLKNDNYQAEYNLATLPLNTWSYIVVTFDQNDGLVKTYFNGQLVRTWSKTNPIFQDNVDLTIGAQTWLGEVYGYPYSFTGLIDEVSIWGRALSSDEIMEHYDDVMGVDPGVAIDNLINDIEDLGLNPGTENSLTSKLNNAKMMLEKNNRIAAMNILEALVNELEAQSGKALTEAQAADLISRVEVLL